MKEQKPVQRNHLPESKNLEIESALDIKLKKSKTRQDKLEKEGKFYLIKDVLPKLSIFVPKGENVQESIENYLKKIGQNNTTLRKLKV